MAAVIKLESTESRDVTSIATQIRQIAELNKIKAKGPIPLPTHILSQTTRKAPGGDGSKTYERWELRVHKRLLVIDVNEQSLRAIMRIPVPDTVQIEISLVG